MLHWPRLGCAPDITVVPLPLDEHLTAWRESQVDARVTFDPVLQVLRGEARRCC